MRQMTCLAPLGLPCTLPNSLCTSLRIRKASLPGIRTPVSPNRVHSLDLASRSTTCFRLAASHLSTRQVPPLETFFLVCSFYSKIVCTSLPLSQTNTRFCNSNSIHRAPTTIHHIRPRNERGACSEMCQQGTRRVHRRPQT